MRLIRRKRDAKDKTDGSEKKAQRCPHRCAFAFSLRIPFRVKGSDYKGKRTARAVHERIHVNHFRQAQEGRWYSWRPLLQGIAHFSWKSRIFRDKRICSRLRRSPPANAVGVSKSVCCFGFAAVVLAALLQGRWFTLEFSTSTRKSSTKLNHTRRRGTSAPTVAGLRISALSA